MINKKSGLILMLIIFLASFLRFWQLDRVPPSLYFDELDLGYQAYSLLHTGRDYFGNFLPLHPHSFAEYRTPFNIYTAIPTILAFGINAYGVRLPSAIFGILGVVGFYLLIKEMLMFNDKGKDSNRNYEPYALLGALLLTLSPWHIQFSRVTLEVSALFTFLTFGLYFFFKSFKNPRFLWLSSFFIITTPWIYSTAKLFIPLLIIFLFLLWRKEIMKFPKKDLIRSAVVFLVLGLPMIYMTVSGRAGSRFSYIGIFTDPTVPTEVNFTREFDATVRGDNQIGTKPKFIDKYFHNKVFSWTDNITVNYAEALSTDFLFYKGDPNLRHSPKGIGQFYWIEIIPLIAGLVFFFGKHKDRRLKAFIAFWIIAGIFPSAVTRDGGNHAARLFLILPPLLFLITFGIIRSSEHLKSFAGNFAVILYFVIWFMSLSFYLHDYTVHYPWDSERWWNSGYEQMIKEVKALENDYDKIYITTADEPPLIFFAAYYPYDPVKWQESIRNGSLTGEKDGVKNIDKFYFDQFKVDALSENLCDSCVYVAAAREVENNLIMEPARVPAGLTLIKSIPLPSGEPVFYLFTKKSN